MRVLGVLLTVCLVRLCSAGCWWFGKSSGIILDLAKPDETKLEVCTWYSGDFKQKFYSPKNGSNVRSIVDGGVTLWKAEAGEVSGFVQSYGKDNVELLYLETSDSSGTKYKHFEKVDKTWKEIDRELFNGKLVALMGEVLDLANPDESKVKISTKNDKGVEHTTYDPKHGSKITYVVDGKLSIWTVPKNEEFISAKLSSKEESFLLLLSLTNGYVYFEKTSNGWRDIDETEYKSRLEDIREELTSPFLDKVDESLFNVEEGQENGLRTLKLTAKEGTSTNKLTFGGLTLWQSQNAGDSCTMATCLFIFGKRLIVAKTTCFRVDVTIVICE